MPQGLNALVASNAVLVPNLNANRHQDRTKPRDDNGAYAHGTLGAFAVDRFEHGRDFAATRARSLPAWRRLLYAAATPLLPAYAAAKHAIAGLTKSLAVAWSSRGINVNCIDRKSVV